MSNSVPTFTNPSIDCWHKEEDKLSEDTSVRQETEDRLDEAKEELREAENRVWELEGEIRALERQLEKMDKEKTDTEQKQLAAFVGTLA